MASCSTGGKDGQKRNHDRSLRYRDSLRGPQASTMRATGSDLHLDSSFWNDPLAWYPYLLAGPPKVIHALIPVFLVARYRDAVTVLGNSRRFSSRLPNFAFIAKIDPFGVPTMLHTDPPGHARLRRPVASYFKAPRLDLLARQTASTTRKLLDNIEAKGKFDAVADLARPLPLSIIAQILGVPIEDQAKLKVLTDEIFAAARKTTTVASALLPGNSSILGYSIPDSNAGAIDSLREYFGDQVSRRRTLPGDDLISAMVSAHRDDSGAGLSTDEVISMAELLLFAGNETTTGMISNGLLALARNPDQFRRLRAAPELIPQAIEEILRYDSPVQMILRYAHEGTNLGGTDIPANSALLVMLAAANRDPAHFPVPDRFDVGRHPNQHLAFGGGIHTCVGAPLARLQGRIAFGAIVERFPRLRLCCPDATVDYEDSILSRTIRCLPMAVQ